MGDGAPSVGELLPEGLRARLSRLPNGTRILAAAVGTQPNLPVLESVVRGAPVERVDALMARYPGLVGELSYRPGLVCEGDQLCPAWRALLLKYPTRFVIGSDTWINQRWQHYESLMRGYRTWLLHAWLRAALARRRDGLHEWSLAQLHVDEREGRTGPTPAQRRLRDALDAFAALDLAPEPWLPAAVLAWYRRG